MADVVTSIRIDADTKAAVAEMARLEGGLGRSSAVMGAAEARAAILSGRLIGLPPAIGAVTSAFATMAPQLAIAAAIIALLSDESRRNKELMEANTKAVDLNAAALHSLASAHDAVSVAARARSVEEKEALKIQLAQLEAAYVAFSNVDNQKRAYISEFGSDEEAMKGWERAHAGMTKAARDQEAQIEALRKTIAALNGETKNAADSGGIVIGFSQANFGPAGPMSMIEDMQKVMADNLAGIGGAGPAGSQQQQEALEALRHLGDQKWQIENEYQGQLDQLSQYYIDLKLARDQRYVNDVENLTAKKNAKLAALDLKSLKLQLQFYDVAGSAFARLIGGQLKDHGGFAAFFVQTTGEGIQAVLKAYGALWAAEGAANALTNPAVAATKFRAAAMAGVASGVVGALTDVAVSSITRESDRAIGQSDINAAGGSTRSTSGRTLVSQGPVTLYYSATFVVNGHVFDKADIFNEFSMWNLENLRRAGLDAGQRAR